MLDVFIQCWCAEIEEGFEVQGNQVCRRVSKIVYDDDTFRCFQDLEKVDCVGIVSIIRRFDALELFHKQLERILQSVHACLYPNL